MTKTTMGSNLLHALNVLTQLGINVLDKNLTVLSSLEILLTIEEPEWNLELTWILDNGDKLFNLIGGEFSGTLVNINFCLFANQVGESASKTLDLGQAEDDISLTLNVSIEDTENVLKLGSLHQRGSPVGAYVVGVGVANGWMSVNETNQQKGL
jgi:hypothetical protein